RRRAARGGTCGAGLARLRVEVGAAHLGSAVGETVHGGAADAGPGADDESMLAREVEEVAVVGRHCRPSLLAVSASKASTRSAMTPRLSRQNWGSSMWMPNPLASSLAGASPVEANSSSYRRLNGSPSAW